MSLTNPANHFEAITTSDDEEGKEFRSLYVGGGGTVVLENKSGDAISFVGVPAGSILPVMGRKVMATGTTATNIVGIY